MNLLKLVPFILILFSCAKNETKLLSDSEKNPGPYSPEEAVVYTADLVITPYAVLPSAASLFTSTKPNNPIQEISKANSAKALNTFPN